MQSNSNVIYIETADHVANGKKWSLHIYDNSVAMIINNRTRTYANPKYAYKHVLDMLLNVSGDRVARVPYIEALLELTKYMEPN